MKDLNNEAFISLFKEGYLKCFGFPLTQPLSETESRHFANKIFEDTGLVIGAKSIKNYSFYVIDTQESKQENPSVSTLDTLARYVLNAPYTDEVRRKETESHYPYWFQYKNRLASPQRKESLKSSPRGKYIILIAAVLITGVAVLIKLSLAKTTTIL